MSRREEILVKHREAIRSAASRHRASSIALVGSVARGDDTDASDYDFLTDFLPGATLFDMAGLKVELEDLLGRRRGCRRRRRARREVPRNAPGSHHSVSRTDKGPLGGHPRGIPQARRDRRTGARRI